MPLRNLYYQRTTGTEHQCFICFKGTTTVLATPDGTSDFLYTCTSHLTDPGFAKEIEDPLKAQIEQAKKEYEERLAKRKAKKAKKAKSKDKDKDKKEDKDSSDEELKPPKELPAGPKKYTLHRDIFAIREDRIKQRTMAKKAKEVTLVLPSAPKGGFPSVATKPPPKS